jgi:hypothetical protein
MNLRTFVSSLLLLAAPSVVTAQSVFFRAARVFTGDSIIPSADVLVRDGMIAAVGGDSSWPGRSQHHGWAAVSSCSPPSRNAIR